MPCLVGNRDAKWLAHDHPDVQGDGDGKPLLCARIGICRKARGAHAEDAVPRRDRAADRELGLAGREGIGRVNRVRDAPLRRPDLEPVAHVQLLGRVDADQAVAKAGDASDRDAAVVGALVAHHGVAALAGEKRRGKAPAERLCKLALLVLGCPIRCCILPRAVERLAVRARDGRDVLGRLHPALDLEGGDARVDELRKDLDAAQVARAQQVLAHIGELLAVFVHEGIRQATRLRAQTAVGAAPADERREQALPRLADAQRTVHEALEVHAEAAQLLDLRDAQLAGERDARGAQLAGELDAPRPADVHLRRRV